MTDPTLNLCNINNLVKELNIAFRDTGSPDWHRISILSAEIRSETAVVKAWADRGLADTKA